MKINIKSQKLIYNILSKNVTVIIAISFLFGIVNQSCTPDHMEQAKKLLIEEKYDLAIEQYNKSIIKHPYFASNISDTCFLIGANLNRMGNFKQANLFYKYALNLCKTNNNELPPNFRTYLESLNNSDSISNLIFSLGDIMSYETASNYLTQLNPPDAKVYPGFLFKNLKGYSSIIWLFPQDTIPENKLSVFGLSTFNPITSYILTKTSLSTINSISPKAFIRGVKEDLIFLTESSHIGLKYSLIPELRDTLSSLKDKDEFLIASERDNVIKKIVELREKYLKANLVYTYTKFEILGKCYAYKSDYNVDSQVLDMQLSLNNQIDGTYITTVRVPLSLKDAQEFFGTNTGYYTSVKFKVSPGSYRKNLGIGGGGVPGEVMPNLYIHEEPLIQFDNQNGLVLKVKTEDLKGFLWPPFVDTGRWDLHYTIDKPDHSFKSNIRINRGIKI